MRARLEDLTSGCQPLILVRSRETARVLQKLIIAGATTPKQQTSSDLI